MKKFLLLLLFSMLATWASAQTVQVKGSVLKVKDRSPIPNAGVIVLHSNRGTATDSLGNFNILLNHTDTLLIRAIGYSSKMYVLPRQRVNLVTVKILLSEADVELEEVIIMNRPSDEEINRAMRNMAPREPVQLKPNPTVIIKQQNPGAPPAAPTVLNPASYLYEMFSDRGKQLKKIREIQEAEAQKEAIQNQHEQQEEYNNLFKNNTGYE